MAIDQPPQKTDKAHDKVVEDTFPASDPPANSGITGPDPADEVPQDSGIDAQPTGTPTSDRHSAETAHKQEPDVKPTSERGTGA